MTTTVLRHPQVRRAVRRRAAGLRLLAVRTQLHVLERLNPRAAGVLAFNLWCTLPDNAGRRKDFRPVPGVLVRVPAPRGGQIAVEVWDPERTGSSSGDGSSTDAPTVYLMHGWGGWRGQLGAFVRPLLDQGFRVVGVDAPSHGESGPGVLGAGKCTLVEFTEALEAAGERFGPAAGLIAHSMGCTAAAMALRSTLSADRLVLVSPNHDFDEITQDFADALQLSTRTRDLLRDAVEGFVQRPLGDFDLEPLGSDGGLPETLLIHDRRDKETPYDVSTTLAGAWPNATLLTTDGLGHQRILADALTIRAAVAHVADATDRVVEPFLSA